jgi:hypothetical protein
MHGKEHPVPQRMILSLPRLELRSLDRLAREQSRISWQLVNYWNTWEVQSVSTHSSTQRIHQYVRLGALQSSVIYASGFQPGVRIPTGMRKGTLRGNLKHLTRYTKFNYLLQNCLNTRNLFNLFYILDIWTVYNLNYTPTTFGVQSWSEITPGGMRTRKKIEFHLI